MLWPGTIALLLLLSSTIQERQRLNPRYLPQCNARRCSAEVSICCRLHVDIYILVVDDSLSIQIHSGHHNPSLRLSTYPTVISWGRRGGLIIIIIVWSIPKQQKLRMMVGKRNRMIQLYFRLSFLCVMVELPDQLKLL